MAHLHNIKRHIRSVVNIKKITKTMEMVAAARMQKTTAALFVSRPYARLAWTMLQEVSTRAESDLHPLLQSRPVRKTLVILVTSDRGLCGAFNMNLIQLARKLATDKEKFRFVTVGKKGRDFLVYRGYQVIADFTNLEMPVPFLKTLAISRIAMEEYTARNCDEVIIVHSNFVSHLVQKPEVLKLLPLREPGKGEAPSPPMIYEPSAPEVISTLVPRIIEYELFAAILENQASEFAARMIAMKNATENAEQLIDNLTLSYNKARQESITKELTELSTSTMVIEEL
jgi:F-type H+-transporting ATPase subunit gamma